MSNCPLHVDDDAPPGGDGSSWANAFQTLQEALDQSAPDQEIWVAGGSYPGVGPSSVGVQPAHPLSLYGGFAGTETSLDQRVLGLHETTLGPATDSILVINDDLLVDGFSLRGGQAVSGGAVRVHTPGFFDGQVTIRNSLLADNAADEGGAIAIVTVAIVVHVIDSELRNNTAGSGSVGHAVDAAFSFEGCNVHDNLGTSVIEAFDGGFDYASLTASGSTFTNNAGVSLRGKYITAIDCLFQDNLDSAIRGQWVEVLGSAFLGNQSDASGAAIAADGGLGGLEDGLILRDSLFVSNHSSTNGGAVAAGELEIERCRFIANTAAEQGGAIFDLSSFGTPTHVRDCEFVDNVAGTRGGGVAGATNIIRSTFTGNLAAGQPNGLDSTNVTQLGTVTASVFWPDTVRMSADPPDDIPVATIDSCIAASPDNVVDLQGSSVELLGSPFVPADLDDDGLLEFYLDPLGPCVDLAALPGPPDPNELDWTTATTALGQCTDAGLLDAGMHYTPLAAVGPC